MRNLIFGAASAMAMTAVLSSPVWADIITIGANRDATIYQGQPNNSNGAGPVIFDGTDAQAAVMRGLVQFNIAANIPDGSTITSAQMTMTLGDAGTAQGPATIELHRLAGNWGQGSTGSGSTVAGSLQGFPAVSTNVTWNERHFQLSQPWTTPGSDFSATATVSAVVGQTVGMAYTWLSTPQLVADVQAMLDAPSLNEGWALLNLTDTGVSAYRAFYTRDWSDPAMRPHLDVTYLAPVPVPAALWLFGSGLLTMMGLVRGRGHRGGVR